MVAAFTSVKGAWSPRLLRPAFWVDARRQDSLFQLSAGTTAVTDGSVCGYVKDLSGNAFDISSPTDASVRPNWIFNNGFSYLDCDSGGTSNTILRRTSSLGIYAGGAASVFIALRANPAVTDAVLAEGSSASSTQLVMFRADSTTASTSNLFVRDDSAVTVANVTLNTSVFDNTDRVAGFVWNGSKVVGYNNLTAGSEASLASGSTLTLDSFGLSCFFRLGAAASNFETRIYSAIVVKRALSVVERIKLTKYMAKGMGLVL